QEILRETLGGYDLAKVHQALNLKGTTPTLSLTEYKEYKKKLECVDEIENNQKKIQKDEQRLTALSSEYEEAKAAYKYKEFYALAIDFLKARREFANINTQKSSFPEQMPLLDGKEQELCSKLEKSIKDCDQKISQITREREANEHDLRSL